MNIKDIVSKFKLSDLTVVDSSVQELDGNFYVIVKKNHQKFLLVVGSKENANDFIFEEEITVGNYTAGIGYLSDVNYEAMLDRFEWMHAKTRHDVKYSFGLGDRLGLASLAHLNLFKDKDVMPVLAQQSIRELMLTGRTYNEVLESAAWAVFEKGYTKGFGADGDHLKNPYEVEYAVSAGFPMITLDASEHIKNGINSLSDTELKNLYDQTISSRLQKQLEEAYLNQTFSFGKTNITFTLRTLMESVLIYMDAIYFAQEIYHDFVIPYELDFEVSIDETAVPTTPENHYFIANELKKRDIEVVTMAPRFCGEFQKAIDYIGDVDVFEKEYQVHQDIASEFGYKLSIHSGSDKFSVFPIIGKISKSGWHVKTAGTNWLEALRVVAKNDPKLMQEIYEYSLSVLDKAKQYYVIDSTKENAPTLESIGSVDGLLENDATRQILHVTFGLILNEKFEGEYVFKDKIYTILNDHFDDYESMLNSHIGRHLDGLGVA